MKKFAETSLGNIIRNVAPHIIDMVGDVLPPVNLIKTLINTDKTIPDENKTEINNQLQSYSIERNELITLDMADRQKARELAMESIKSDDKFIRRFNYTFAIYSVSIGFIYIFLITFLTIPPENVRFADTILGVVISAMIVGIYQFIYGSSLGSKFKDSVTKK